MKRRIFLKTLIGGAAAAVGCVAAGVAARTKPAEQPVTHDWNDKRNWQRRGRTFMWTGPPETPKFKGQLIYWDDIRDEYVLAQTGHGPVQLRKEIPHA